MGEWLFKSKGKPVLVLGVQCHNSSAYDAAEMETAWQVLEQMNGNTMEVPVYWDKIEPEEGRFDFSIVDDLLDQARARGKYLIFLWFATWKNGSMKYCPLWVKHDQERFHRVINQDGTALPLLSPHCAGNRNADAKAFRELMKYIGKADSEHQTVLAVQVENEPGYAARTVCDYGPDGREAAAGRVPGEVLDFIISEGAGSEFDAWKAAGGRAGGTWQEVFGSRGYDLMTAHAVASYIDYVAACGKAEYELPMYVNVWLDHQLWDQPGLGYPAGAPVTRNLVLWKSCTPHLDVIAPDVYLQPMSQVKEIYSAYARPDNPLYIPESSPAVSNALNMVRAFAEHGLQGICYFGAESYLNLQGELEEGAEPGRQNYQFLGAIAPLLIKYRGTDRIHALYQEEFALEMQLKLRNYEAVVSFDSNPAADLGRIRSRRVGWFNKKWEGKAPRGRGILIECEDGTLYLAGAGIRLSLRRFHDEGVPYSPIVEERHVNYDLVWEGTLSSDCTFTRRRIRSGDETDNAIFATPDSGVIKIVLGD